MILTVNIPNGKYISIASEIFKSLYVHFYIIIYSSKSFICQNYICLFLFLIPFCCPIYSMPNIIYFLTGFSHWSKLFSGAWSCTLNVILILKWPYFIHLFFLFVHIVCLCVYFYIMSVKSRLKFSTYASCIMYENRAKHNSPLRF